MGLLNLADADLKGFDPLEPGRYEARVHEITMDSVKNDGGKLPVGTPMIKIQYRLTGEEYNNRALWQQFAIPPADYDPKKAATMKGMIAKWFIALGESEETVLSKKFDPDLQDYVGRECVLQVGKEPKKDRNGNVIDGEFNNPVKSIKPAGSGVETAASAGGLL